jgi:hypothetical protein
MSAAATTRKTVGFGQYCWQAPSIAGFAVTRSKARDEEQKHDAAVRALFGGESATLENEDDGDPSMEIEPHEFERRIDALCDALFHADDSAAELLSPEVSPPPASGTAGLAVAARRSASIHEAKRERVKFADKRGAPKRTPASRGTLKRRLGTVWLVACLALAGVFGLRPPAAPQRPAVIASASQAHARPQHASRAIEDIRVGQRVLGENPDLADSEHSTETAVDPATWRLVRLHAEGRWEDGTLDTVEVETLQPLSWIAASGARIGRSVPIPCDLEELALPLDMHGTVTAIEPCPELEEGPGHLVLLTVNHLNNTVCDLVVTDAAGNREAIGVTAIHRFFSDTRRDWVAAANLRIGEQLRGIDGPLTVERLTRRAGTDRVYNMTVEGEHLYRVSTLGALVHNTYGPGPGAPFPNNATAGQTLGGIDPSSLQAGRANLWQSRLTTQQNLVTGQVPRANPITVTPQGVIYNGNHGARAAAEAGVSISVEVIDETIPGFGPVTGLPILPL